MAETQQAILPDHVLSAVLVLAAKQRAEQSPGGKRLAFRGHDFELQEIFNKL